MVAVVAVVALVAPAIPAVAQVAAHAGQIGAVTIQSPTGWLIAASAWEVLIVGTEIQNETAITFDCWKPVLRDTSTTPSTGKMMREIMQDPRIKDVVVKKGEDENRPNVRLVNVWGDQFDIEYVVLPTGNLALHAVPTA